MKKIQSIAIVFALVNFSSLALGQTVLPLNTGFNHSTGSIYLGGADNYWINLATSPPTSPPTAPSWVIPHQPPWLQPMPPVTGIPGTNWISAWNTIGGQVDPVTKIGTSLFRKCFCLMSFKDARLEFDIRADDNIIVYLNTALNIIIPSSPGQHANPVPLSAVTTDQTKFRIGINCLYVFLEDTGGYMGFNLRGTMRAFGLMPMLAMGTETSFAPCGCDFSARVGAKPGVRTKFDDRQVVQEILRAAEARHAARRKSATK
jgi:hypothetical protein